MNKFVNIVVRLPEILYIRSELPLFFGLCVSTAYVTQIPDKTDYCRVLGTSQVMSPDYLHEVQSKCTSEWQKNCILRIQGLTSIRTSKHVFVSFRSKQKAWYALQKGENMIVMDRILPTPLRIPVQLEDPFSRFSYNFKRVCV